MSQQNQFETLHKTLAFLCLVGGFACAAPFDESRIVTDSEAPLSDVSVPGDGGDTRTSPELRVRYVLGNGRGDDFNDGGSWRTAFRTIQAAYDSLPDNEDGAEGVIMLGPGLHDVHDGLRLSRAKGAQFRGVTRGRGYAGPASPEEANRYIKASPLLMSSAFPPPRSLVTAEEPAGTIGWGFQFQGLWFLIDQPGIEHHMRLVNMSQMTISNCGFMTTKDLGDSFISAVSVDVEDVPGPRYGDSSWGRFTNNYVHRGGLQLGRPDAWAGNRNQWVIRDNIFWGFDRTDREQSPAIGLHSVNRSVVTGNNIERFAVGILLTSGSYQNHIFGNGGEAVSTFVEVVESHANFINTTGAAGPKESERAVHIRTRGGSGLDAVNNFVTISSATHARGLYVKPYQDDTPNQLNWAMVPSNVLSRNFMWLPGLKSGSGYPEGQVMGRVGDMYTDNTGSSGATLFVKESGNNTTTGWIAK